MIVLENLTYRFVRPNVLDVKLGTQLFDDDATAEKQERMRLAALATTSATAGMRLTGFQVSLAMLASCLQAFVVGRRGWPPRRMALRARRPCTAHTTRGSCRTKTGGRSG